MPKRRYGAGPAADHGYATSGRQSNSMLQHQGMQQKDTTKDHPYATTDTLRRPLISNSTTQYEAVNTPPLSLVSSEHSYGTRLKITEEPSREMGGSDSRDRRYDHPYSAWQSSAPTQPSLPLSPPKTFKTKIGQVKQSTVGSKNKSKEEPSVNEPKSKRLKALTNNKIPYKEHLYALRDSQSGLEEKHSAHLGATDHQYASNRSSLEPTECLAQPLLTVDSPSKFETEKPSSSFRISSPPRGAAKRKASLNLQRSRNKPVTTNIGNGGKQVRAQLAHPPVGHIPSVASNVSEQPTTAVMGTELVVRLHQLRPGQLMSPGPTISNKLPIPPLPNNRTRAGTRNNTVASDFPCQQCEKRFPQKYRRARHIREVHDKEKRHHCKICEKSFFKVIFFTSNYIFVYMRC